MKKNGISLIVLVITIVVIIILAAAVVLALSQNNPINDSKIAGITQTRDSLTSGILIYSANVQARTVGELGIKDILINNDDYSIVENKNSDFTITKGTDEIILYKLDKTKAKDKLNIDLKNEDNWYIDEKGVVYLAYLNFNGVPNYLKDNDKILASVSNFVVASDIVAPAYDFTANAVVTDETTGTVTISGKATSGIKSITYTGTTTGTVTPTISGSDYTATANVWDGTYTFVITDNTNTALEKEVTLENVTTCSISTLDDLEKLRDLVSAGNTFEGITFTQTADINLNEGKYTVNSVTKEVTFSNDAIQWSAIGTDENRFKGNFIGNNHIIKGIYIDNLLDNQGLFGVVDGSEISNIVLDEGIIKGNQTIAGIVAKCYNTEISHCTNYCSVSSIANGAGGIVSTGGLGTNFKISNCSNYGNINAGVDGAGGVVSFLTICDECEITNCINRGNVEALRYNAGGILNSSSNTVKKIKIINCSNEGNITSINNAAAGIIATSFSDEININNCSNIGVILSEQQEAGGIVGLVQNNNNSPVLTINNCYNNGYIESLNYHTGGIISAIVGTTAIITNSYNLCHIKSLANIGGIIGGVTTSSTCTIQDCYNTGFVECTSYNGGGIAGGCWANSTLTVNECYNRGDVSTINHNSAGILGVNACLNTTINNSYNNATISGQDYVSGIVGSQDAGTVSINIENCYNVGQITSTNNHSESIIILRANNTKTISNCYYLNTKKSSSYATSKTEDQLKSLTTLGSSYKFDTNNINNGYPILIWE